MLGVNSILLGLLAIASVVDSATPNDLRAKGVAEFNLAYKTWDGARFVTAAELFRRASAESPASATNFYLLGVTQFHYMLQLKNAPANRTNKADSDAALEAALAALTHAVTLNEHHAESHALLATLYGMKINGSLFQGLKYGPRVLRHQELSLKYGPSNPRVQYLLGMCQLHTAEESDELQLALQTLLKAKKLFEAESTASPPDPQWGYDSCLTFLGLAYERLGQRKESAAYFRKALIAHPADHLAKEGLKRVSASK